MLRLRQKPSCKEKFKKLQILTVPSLYILEMMLVIKILTSSKLMFQLKRKDMRQINQLHLQSVRLPSVQKQVCHSSLRIFNKLPPHIVQLCENTMAFKNTLNKFLIKNAFHSMNLCRVITTKNHSKCKEGKIMNNGKKVFILCT